MKNRIIIKQPTGMAGFTIVWTGQLVSVLASSMTQFGLTIWAYQETGKSFFAIRFIFSLLGPIWKITCPITTR